MIAVRVHKFGDVDQLKLEDDVIVPTCDDDKVLIRIFAIGINPVDTYIRQGAFSSLPDLPYIPGVDGAGIVEEVGDNITKFEIGERVFFSKDAKGSYAELIAVPETSCFHLSAHLSFKQGAAIGVPYFTAYRALFQKACAKKGQHVLVHGASGAVGIAVCQLAKNAGLIVYGTAGTKDGEKVVKESGLADFVANHKEHEYLSKLAEATPDKLGFDIIIEMLANVNLSNDLPLLKQDGVVVVVGSRGKISIDPRNLMSKESKIVGVALFSSSDADWNENICAVLNGLKNKQLTPIVGKVYTGLEEAAKAQKDIIEAGGSRGKLVIEINQK